MNMIVAVDKNWAIGYKGGLLVSIPEDMKFFRTETSGKVVVMGRKTLESFPNGLPLKNRTNLVLTRNPGYQVKGAAFFSSVEDRFFRSSKGCTSSHSSSASSGEVCSFLPTASSASVK